MIKRKNFSAIKSVIDYPDFLDIQLKSFQDFFQLDTPPENRAQEGLFKVFSENFPISDSRANFVLEFIDYFNQVFAKPFKWTYTGRPLQTR